VTAQGAGFHATNSVYQEELQLQTFDALANLTATTKSDRSAISNLMAQTVHHCLLHRIAIHSFSHFFI
jgi:hypothetical protein